MVETRRSAKKEKLPMNSGEEETNDGDENSTLKGSTDSEQKTPEKDTSEDVTKDQIGTPSSSSRRNKKRSQGPCLIQPKHAWQKDQKVNVYSKTKLLGVLHKKMSDKQKRVMKNSFLWNFWELPTANFPTQLLLQIIRRRVHNDDKSLLTFNICGYTVDFTMEDFAIITGLICDDIKFTNLHKLPTSSIEKKFFKTHTVHSLKALLEEIDDYDFHNDKMSIKVAKLAMLESIVIANQQKNTISDLHFRLVEDDDSFESYPWGRISYDMLRQSVTRAVGSNTSLCMAVSGCAYALIYWAFERIPALSIGEKYARRISYDEPRLLAWDVMRHGTCKELDKDVFNDQIVVHEMRPVENPEKCYYLTEFQQMKKRKGKSVEQEVHVQKTDVLGSSNTDEEAQSISDETSNVPGYTKLNKKLDKISTAVAALAKRVEFIADIVYMRYLNDEKERRNVDKEKDGKKGTMSDNERERGTNSKDGGGENEEGIMGDAEGDKAEKNIHGFHENEDRADSQADVHVGRNDTILGDVIVENKDDKKGTEVEELREEQPPFDPIDELVTNIVADLADDDEHIMEDPPEHNDNVGSQEILTKQREQTDLETENIAMETVDNVAAVVDDTLATQETGLLTSKRPCRAKNLGQYFKEPYTDAFGSADPKGKKPAKKRRSERTGKAVTGKATKKGKLKGVQTEQTDVETHKPSEENEPGFDINLTATVNEIRAEKENK